MVLYSGELFPATAPASLNLYFTFNTDNNILHLFTSGLSSIDMDETRPKIMRLTLSSSFSFPRRFKTLVRSGTKDSEAFSGQMSHIVIAYEKLAE
jgi:hypothetical protein